MLWLVEVLLSC